MKSNSLIKQFLSESLDNPYPYFYSANIGGFIFHPKPENQKIFYTIQLLEDPDYTAKLQIVFDYTDEDKFIRGMKDMTNTGDAFRVIATVAKIVVDCLKENKADRYEIISYCSKTSESGKSKLFKRLGKSLKNFLGSKWSFGIFRDKHKVVYELSKIVLSK
jgi:hypothetical protein